MHLAQKYVNDHLKGLPGTEFRNVVLDASQATGLNQALLKDAYSYMYSGCVSIADAVQALDRSLYTWATVKLYYSLFYLVRSLIATTGTAIVYEGTKGFTITCLPGESPKKREGTTHKATLAAFKMVLPHNKLFSQPIDTIVAPDWLMARREEANYKKSRFSEPAPPEHFKYIASKGVRRAVETYVDDDTFLYAFQPQHAMLALPIEAFKMALEKIGSVSEAKFMPENDANYLQSIYCDNSGPIDKITAMIASVACE